MSSQSILERNSTPVVSSVPNQALHSGHSLQDVIEFAGLKEFPDVWWISRVESQETRKDIGQLSAQTRFGKRLLDLFVSTILLILLAPVMLLVAILVKLTSPGPAIFKQTRVGLNLRQPGKDRRESHTPLPVEGDRRQIGSDRRTEFAYGRHFTLYKFRTMRNDAEKDGAKFAVKGDVRITSIGRFLRKTRLDELPQLINVIRGEMSLVGPRPERPEFMQELSGEIPYYLDRLGLKPGLTGVAQIINGYDNEIESFRRKAAFDLFYLQHCTTWNDFKILVRTVKVVLSGSG
ncbi:MAG: sugar transferase, partial [Planctomicrobium sp.]|nr:sugar transferase [Planctomicrobium sp.]